MTVGSNNGHLVTLLVICLILTALLFPSRIPLVWIAPATVGVGAILAVPVLEVLYGRLSERVKNARGELIALEDRAAGAPLISSLCMLIASCGGPITCENSQMKEVSALSSVIAEKRGELRGLENKLITVEKARAFLS